MKHLIVIALGASLWLAPTAAQACGCCNHDTHHAGAPPAQPAGATPGPGEARVEIPVTGIHCGHCASRIETALERLDGVRSADVRLSDGKVVVVFEKAKLAPSKLVETIDALGFEAGAPAQG
jgi:copper chaperone CopZ